MPERRAAVWDSTLPRARGATPSLESPICARVLTAKEGAGVLRLAPHRPPIERGWGCHASPEEVNEVARKKRGGAVTKATHTPSRAQRVPKGTSAHAPPRARCPVHPHSRPLFSSSIPIPFSIFHHPFSSRLDHIRQRPAHVRKPKREARALRACRQHALAVQDDGAALAQQDLESETKSVKEARPKKWMDGEAHSPSRGPTA